MLSLCGQKEIVSVSVFSLKGAQDCKNTLWFKQNDKTEGSHELVL